MNAETPIADGDLAEAARWRKRRRLRGPLMLIAPVAVIAGALYFYLSGGRFESTENAQLQTGLVAVSASVAGKVSSVEVTENQLVKMGQVLFTVDSDSFGTAVSEAEAQLAAARTDVAAKQADYAESVAEVRAAQAKLAFAQREARRQGALVKEGIASRAAYDAALLSVQSASDAIVSAQAHAASVRAELAEGPTDIQPQVRRAAAQAQKARIALSDTVVRAPIDGIVTKVHQLQPGNYVVPGKPVFMLAGTRFWVTANFKENQLRYMRVGQSAKVKIDAFPDHEIQGRIASFSPGTGNAFSVLPAENATGNWVKVVQRLPVEIAIDQMPKGLPLHMGLSAEVTVDTGHQRRLFR